MKKIEQTPKKIALRVLNFLNEKMPIVQKKPITLFGTSRIFSSKLLKPTKFQKKNIKGKTLINQMQFFDQKALSFLVFHQEVNQYNENSL